MSTLITSMQEACGKQRWVITTLGVLLCLFLLAPIVLLVLLSFTSSFFLIFPPDLFSLRWYEHVLQDPAWRDAFFVSIQTSIGATIVSVTGGTLAALAIRRAPDAGDWLTTIFIAPLIIPVIGYAVGLYLAFGLFSMAGTIWAVMLGQGILALPLAFITISGGLANIPRSLDRAAQSMGAYWPRIVWSIELPLLRPNLIAATLITLVFTFDEVVLAIFLTSPGNPTLPVQIWKATIESVSPAITAVGSMVMAAGATLALLASVVINWSNKRRDA